MKVLTIAVLLFATFTINGQNLEVEVRNVMDQKGVLMVGLFTSEKTFTKEAWRGLIPPARAGVVRVVFENIPPGEYAVSVFHDANQNGRLDSNLMGVPKEGVGFSNDVMGTFGPPTFEKAKFKCPVPKGVTVTLKYF